MASAVTGLPTAAEMVEQTKASIAATDAALATQDLEGAEARHAVATAINELNAISVMIRTPAGSADRDSYFEMQTALYEAANRWLWLANRRDVSARPSA